MRSQALSKLKDPREQRFVERYCETNNATRSALVAGYGSNYASAGTTASRLLKRAEIRNAIDQRNAELMDELDFTPDRVLREIAAVARINLADFTTIDEADGSIAFDFRGATRRELASLASIERDDAPTEFGVRVRNKIKGHDKLKALDMLAKLLRMYPAERTEITGADGGPLTAVTLNATQHKIDIAGMTLEEREQLKQTLLMLKAKQARENNSE